MRLKIAEHMVASKHVSPHVYSVDEIDMTKIASLRAKSKDEFERNYGTKLTFMPFFVKAVVAGLRAYPTLNASLDGTNVVRHKEINIGIAVALDWGLIVPVVKSADEKNILGIKFGAARKVIRPGDNGVVDDQGFVVHEIVPSGWCVRG